MTSKERCLAAIAGRPVDRVPVFPLLMFLPAHRLGVSYREYATNGHALAEAQLKIRQIFKVDAVTACSDAFRISADLGGRMEYPENGVPHLAVPLVRSEADLVRLARLEPMQPGSRMADRVRGVAEMTRAAGEECLVLGWVDMPFAEACSACGVSEFMMLLYDDPELAHRILEFLTGLVVDFSLAQLEAGAPMIGAGDAAASLLSEEMYRNFALPYERRVFESIHEKGGLGKLHICGNTTQILPVITSSGADLYNVDHLVDFDAASSAYDAAGACFKGNMDPVRDILQSEPEACRRRALECIRKAEGKRYMLSAGCEIPSEVSDEVLAAFCAAPSITP
jgi:MtaA/CmuA family methyltransferase